MESRDTCAFWSDTRTNDRVYSLTRLFRVSLTIVYRVAGFSRLVEAILAETLVRRFSRGSGILLWTTLLSLPSGQI